MNPHLAERLKDLALIVVLAVVGVGGILFINFQETEFYPGPGGLTWRTLPFIYSGVLLILVAIFAASTLLDIWMIRKGQEPRSILGEIKPSITSTATKVRRAVVFVSVLVYAWALGQFGFAVATPVLLLVLLVVLGRPNHLESLFIALVGTLVMWILFVGILRLPMTGELWDPLTPILKEAWRGVGFR